MRTKKAQAPDNLIILLAREENTFTAFDVAKWLDLSYRQARAAIDYGITEEKIRMVQSLKEASHNEGSLYESILWRREWVTRPWKL